jgi:formate dehydrogenase major subunit
VSFQKAIYGKAATADNNWAYDWLPKLDIPLYDIIAAFEMMDKGEINGYICQGFNPLQAFPDNGKIRRSLGKLKYLVVWTSRYGDVTLLGEFRAAESRRPGENLDGSLSASNHLLRRGERRPRQFGALAAMALEGRAAPGEAQSDIFIIAGLFHRLSDMYRKDGGTFPDPLLNLTWDYINPVDPDPEEMAKEMTILRRWPRR